jgi:hypothetical protein
MGAGSLLAAMYEAIRGDLSSAVSADINGNMLERMQALSALAGGFPGLAPKSAAGIPGWDIPSAAIHLAGGSDILAYGPAVATAAVQHAWDNTEKKFQVGNDASAAQHFVRQALGANDGILTPYGLGGVMPAFANPNGHILPPNALTRCLVLEFYGKITVGDAGLTSSDRGVGFYASTGATPFDSTNRHVIFRRRSDLPLKWYVQSCTGLARGFTASTPDADSNWHLFRLEWHPTEARLYLDGVLLITHTTSMPAIDNNLNISIVGWNVPTGAGADAIVVSDWLCYWKAAA